MISIPTLQELYNDVLTDLQSELNISIPLFGKSVLRAIAGVQAAKLKLYYLAIADLQKNQWVDTAEPEEQGGNLERFGRVKLERDRFPAVAAQYLVDVTGDAAAVIPASQTFKSNDDSQNPGQLFILDAEYILSGGGDQITLRALEAGTGSQLAIADKLTSTAPILNVESEVVVDSSVVEPVDRETIEEYREKTIEAFRLEPQGGAASDYRIWSSDVNGVRTVYPYADGATANSILVYVESTTDPGTAPPLLLAEVAAVIELDPDTTKPIDERGRRPLGILEVDTITVTVLDIAVEITGLATTTAAIQAAITSAVTDLLFDIRPFIAGADVLEDQNDTLTNSKLSFAIQSVLGTSNYFESVSFEVDGSPATTFQFLNGDIPGLDTITYV